MDFGAICDGRNDDTAAVQRALNHCAQANYPNKLIVPGRTRLTKSVSIDRPVDNTTGEFILEGSGEGAGFFVDSAVTMFTSSLTGKMFGRQRSPSSEYITFRDLLLEGGDASLPAFAVSDRLFRYRVERCSIRRLKWLQHADYVQSVYFVDCNVRGWEGAFFTADDGYDVSIRGCSFEAGGAGFRFRGAVTKFAAFGEIFESCGGPFVAISGVNALTICGMYFEENDTSEIVLGENSGVSRAINIIGCSFNLPKRRTEDYPINLGLAYAVNITGNYSNGLIADNEKVYPWNLRSDLNHATSGGDGLKISASRELQAAARGLRQVDAFEIRRPYNVFTTSSDLHQAVRLPFVRATEHIGVLMVVNATERAIQLFPGVGQRFQGRPTNAPIKLPVGSTIEVRAAGVDTWVAHGVVAVSV